MDDQQIAALRRLTEADRLQLAFEMWKMARSIMRAAIHQEHPHWESAQIEREIAIRISRGAVLEGLSDATTAAVAEDRR